MNRLHFIILAILACTALVGTVCAQTTTVEGTVHDPQGAVIPDASVVCEAGSYRSTVLTGAEGHFVCRAIPAQSGFVEIRFPGFGVNRKSWSSESSSPVVMDIVLEPASTSEELNVSATRTEIRLAETPGSTVLLTQEDVLSTPALRVDDVLRQVPGFSLFRRSDSRTANASNQGVSLRGLGGTAASRAVVLEDGLPLVDAFGGWVYWDRVPRESISSVEVFRGGASNLYGSDALGGVVQFITRQPRRPAFMLETSYGNENTPDLSFWTGTRVGKWDFSLASELFRTDGFILVPAAERGLVDTAANSKDASVELNIGHQVGENGRIFARGDFYTEFRHNGTPIQTNDTKMGEGALGYDQQFGNDSLMLRAYGQVQAYDQRFSSIAPDRNSESLTNLQYVPEQVVGGAGQWTHLLGKHQTLIAGADALQVMGFSDEQLFTAGTHTRNNSSGGRQRIVGFFGEDMIRWNKWTVIAAARVDDWNNFN
ncbi:MAG TPA: TonB-dependent receptor, partial [Candidatus Sulfotelmatobacter sp.]|nr:TonB-dependent receptor [Candidatus Sulfotelmatobacter sp.]